MSATARTATPTLCEKLAAYFHARPGTWVDGMIGLVRRWWDLDPKPSLLDEWR